MNKNKLGFTMAEVLVSMVIIGVVMALSVQTINVVRASYTSLTYYTLENVKSMITAIYAGDTPDTQSGKSGIFKTNADGSTQEIDSPITKCKMSSGQVKSVLKGVETNSPAWDIPSCNNIKGTQSNIFCEAIAAVSNTSGKVNCSKTYPIQMVNGEPLINANFESDQPNFKTTNGQKYYISDWKIDNSISNTFGFRVMAIDLNGNSKPNIGKQKGRQYPDVVNFVIFDDGEVFPVGVAADNIKIGTKKISYLAARVKGYYYSYNPARKNNVPTECTFTTATGEKKSSCNFGVVLIGNDNEVSSLQSDAVVRVFTYRQAYCTVLGTKQNDTIYNNYCSSVVMSSKAKYCPPSNDPSAFDLCLVDTIKPAFRFNLK